MSFTFYGFTTLVIYLRMFLNLRATYNLRPSYEHFVKHTYECS